jgi:hypothetical protein
MHTAQYDGSTLSMERAADSGGAWEASQGAGPGSGAARWLPLVAIPYALVVCLLLARQADLPGLLHDDGVYVAMARGIEQGHGPVDTHLGPDARTARFPPLYPLVLAATRSLLGVAPDGLDGSRRWVALNGLFLAAGLAAFLRWLVAWRRLPPLVALCAGLLAFTLPTLLGVAQHCMSESLFVALLCLALLLAEGAAPPASGRRWLAAALVAGLLPATRTIGAAALLALALHHGRSRRSLGAGLRFAAIGALPWIAGAAWSALSEQVAARSPLYGPPYRQLLIDHLPDAPWIAAVNAVRFADWLAYLLAPQWPLADGRSGAAALLRLLPATLLVLAAGGAAIRAARRGATPSATAGVVVASLLLLLPWPYPDLRFLLPLAPFAIAALASALGFARGLLAPRAAPRATALLAALPLVALLGWNLPLARAVLLAADRAAGHAGFFGQSLPIAAFDQAAAELARRARTAGAAPAFACPLDSLFALKSGVRGVSAWVNDQPFEEGYLPEPGGWRRLWYTPVPSAAAQERMFARADQVLAEYRRLGVRWLLLPRMPGAGMPSHQALLDRLLLRERAAATADAPPRFTPAWRSADGAFELWEVAPAR